MTAVSRIVFCVVALFSVCCTSFLPASNGNRQLAKSLSSFTNPCHQIRILPTPPSSHRSLVTRRGAGLDFLPGELVDISASLFRYNGNVPFLESFGLQVVLFGLLRSKLLKLLTPTGFAHAFALATMLWTSLGWRGWTTAVVYFFCGSAVTKVKFAEKEKKGIAEARGGRRGPENVWGSAATALLCAACAAQGDSFLGIGSNLFTLGYVASLATKLADTFASEIGKAYGKTTFLITTLEKVPPGTEGAVSLEGTAASVVGGLILSLYGWSVGLIDGPSSVAVATVAAFLATNVESVLGATLQGKDDWAWLTNELVNFINTFVGAVFAILGGKMLLNM